MNDAVELIRHHLRRSSDDTWDYRISVCLLNPFQVGKNRPEIYNELLHISFTS